MAESNQEFSTILGADAKFKGDLHFESAAKLLGRLEGSITSKGKVLIADGAECKATVKAKEVAVEGKIDGNVEAGDRIELKKNGVVMGDIIASRMTMSEGASINGHCHIGPNGGQSKASTTAEPKPEAVKTPETAKSR